MFAEHKTATRYAYRKQFAAKSRRTRLERIEAMSLFLQKRCLWLGLVVPLLLHSPAMAQRTPVQDETGRIDGALRIVKNDYVTPIDEAVLASTCRDGILDASKSQSMGTDATTISAVVQLIPLVLERMSGALTARQLGDACLHRVFKQLDARSTYFDQKELEKLRQPARSVPSEKLPGGQDKSPAEVVGHRQEPNTLPVSCRVLDGKYLYLRVPTFREKTLEQLDACLHAVDPVALREITGMVLDLRDNPGGLLTTMIDVATIFLRATSPIATTVGRTREANTVYLAKSNPYYRGSAVINPLREIPLAVKTLPLLVLVNHQTCAGAEAVAAALQDNQRAMIVGEKTQGSGTVQTFRALSSDTVIKLTTSKLFRPSGDEWDKKGVTPDYSPSHEVDSGVELGAQDDAELAEAVGLLEKH